VINTVDTDASHQSIPFHRIVECRESPRQQARSHNGVRPDWAISLHQQYLSDVKNPGGYCNHGLTVAGMVVASPGA
jgi:hypothetical protein